MSVKAQRQEMWQVGGALGSSEWLQLREQRGQGRTREQESVYIEP